MWASDEAFRREGCAATLAEGCHLPCQDFLCVTTGLASRVCAQHCRVADTSLLTQSWCHVTLLTKTPAPLLCMQDLLLAANDQPFRFPATFTFVVRSFTVLDGIGKSLDPRFDISEISAPYARNLLLEGQPQVRTSAVTIGPRCYSATRVVF